MKGAVLLTGVLLAMPLAASAQRAADTGQWMRDAVARESAGDLAGAEVLLRQALEKSPASLSAILSLERVLKLQGKPQELIPVVEKLLAVDPESPVGNQLLVRTYASMNDLEAMRKAGDAWIRVTPKLETPYREMARIWEARGDYGRAIQYLEQGRSKVGRADALALELGDVYVAMEEYPRAVREYERAIGPEARGFTLVQRRLAALPDGGAQLVPRLIDMLLKSPTSLSRRKAATQLAIDAGLGDRAEQIARANAAELRNLERQSYLVEIARRADGAQLPKLAHWAYSELIKLGGNADQLLALRARMAELALQMGDTARAAETYRALETSYAPGSPQRRQALALRIQLTAREGKLQEAQTAMREFRQEFADAPELDEVAAAVANGYLDAGEPEQAEAALIGVSGPRTGLARSRIALRRGDIPQAKTALLGSAPLLHGAEQTETIRLATALGRVSREGGELLGRAVADAASRRAAEAVASLVAGAEKLPGSEGAIILEFAASIAERSELPEEAEKARRLIVEKYATTAEAPAALLALARTLSVRNETLEEARQYLEQLILEHPRSALLPQARQELDRLQGRAPRT